MEHDPSSNKVMQFTYQLQNTASQKVQKQIVLNNRQTKIKKLVCNVYAYIVSQCYYELISLLYFS